MEKFLNSSLPVVKASKFMPFYFAVINGYVDVNLGAVPPELGNNVQVLGGELKQAIQSFTVAATDSALSVYRVFKGLSPDIVVSSIEIYNDAMSGATSVDVGAWGVLDYDNVGAAINATCFASAVDIHLGNPVTTGAARLDTALSIANRENPAWTVYGDTQYPAKHPAWDLALRFNNAPVQAGNVCVKLSYVQL
jgi:hypothetical protein